MAYLGQNYFGVKLNTSLLINTIAQVFYRVFHRVSKSVGNFV